MKKFFILTFCLLQINATLTHGQSGMLNVDSLFSEAAAKYSAEFEASRDKANDDYNSFMATCNSEFAAFLAEIWPEYNAVEGEEPPTRPIPPEPIIKEDVDIELPPIKFPVKEIVKIPSAIPVAPIFTPPIKEEPNKSFKFEFIGEQIAVGLTQEHHFTLPSIKEQDIANMWQTLSNGIMEDIISDCLYWRDKMQLNDYFYMLMLESMCSAFFDSTHINEARLMKTYITTQSGYDAKCCRSGDEIVMILAIEEDVYRTTYLDIDGRRYYVVDRAKDNDGKYFTFPQRFSEESKSCSMRIESEIAHPQNRDKTKKYTSKFYPSLNIETTVDKNLIDAYNSYPRCEWSIYATAPMSSNLTNVVYPKIKSEIEGRSEFEAANIIINFVQTAFEYKTDPEHFGEERSLFVDETFYYPYSDCEDRAILYTNLIRNILGLDVVLLYYPGHLATAVKFNSDYTGDYMMINGEKYIICDPTYSGANIGVAMPTYKDVSAEVFIL